MPSIPLFKTDNLQIDLFQTKLKSQLDPVLSNLLVQGQQINNIALGPGVTAVNHLLGRMQLGWSIADINGPATIWRSQPFTSTTLTLNCSSFALVTLSLWVW